MTELKKLTTLCQEVEEISKSLSNNSTNNDDEKTIRHLQEQCDQYALKSKDLRERTDKILLRAREKDPEKQMYNEATCAKIEQLGTEVDRILNPQTFGVTEDLILKIESGFLQMLRRLAAEKALAAQTAATIDVLTADEKDARLVITFDAKAEWGSVIMDAERKGRNEVHRIEGERSQAKWKREEMRRAQENEKFKKIGDQVMTFMKNTNNGFDQLKAFIKSELFGENRFAKIKEMNPAAAKFLHKKLAEILQTLMKDPEQEGLRVMRADAERFVKTFGHQYLFNSNNNSNNTTTNNIIPLTIDPLPLEKLASETAEFTLALIGYRPTYTGSPLLDGHWIDSGKPFKLDLVQNSTSTSCCFLYYDYRVAKNRYFNEEKYSKTTPPWFPYSDRRLTLQEPSVADNPDEWIMWHDALKSVTKIFCEESV